MKRLCEAPWSVGLLHIRINLRDITPEWGLWNVAQGKRKRNPGKGWQ